MTRNEIVKALRCFACAETCNCPADACNEKCPYWIETDKFYLDDWDAEISDEYQLCRVAADMLEQDAKKTSWISVKDRLPKETQDCASGVKIKSHSELCIVAIETEESAFYVQTDITVCGKWYNYGNRVTHWMPLPEPPEENGGMKNEHQ